MHDFHASLAAVSTTEPVASCARLENYALFSAAGTDALTFLHGQLTNDVTGLKLDDARLAGFCTAKGRLLATMAIWRAASTNDTDEPMLIGFMRRSLAEPVIKRLRMFVLRAKVRFETPALTLSGVWADADKLDALSAAAGGALPTNAWSRASLPSGTWIAAPHDGSRLRWWWTADSAQLDYAATELAGLMASADESRWQQDDVAQGLPWIEAATQDLFIPQTVNLDLIQGVSFTKGCYPGQEIVARSHYLGKVKRRMAYGTIDAQSLEGLLATDVYETNATGEPCGRIIDAAVIDGTASVLLETTLSIMSQPGLHLGKPDGPKIALKPLPYPLA